MVLLTEEKKELISQCNKFLQRHDYYYPVIQGLRIKENKDVPTAGMSAKLELTYNPEFVKSMMKDQTTYQLVEHEILHYCWNHHQRFLDYVNGDKRKLKYVHRLLNIAADLEINSHIKDLPEGFLNPVNFGFKPKLTMEEYTRLLIQKFKEDKENGSGQGEGEDGEGQTGKGFMNELADKILDQLNFDPSKNPFEDVNVDELDKKVAEQIKETLQDVEDIKEGRTRDRGIGTCGQDAKVTLEEQKYNWKDVLRNYIVRKVKKIHGDDYNNYSRPSRRSFAELDVYKDFVLPSKFSIKKEIDIVVIMDVSGSMGYLINQMYGLLKNLCNTLNTNITVLETEDEVINTVQIGKETKQVNIKYGGGTDMSAGWKYIDENQMKADMIICCTDSYTPWGDPPLFIEKSIVMTDNANHNSPYKTYIVEFDK